MSKYIDADKITPIMAEYVADVFSRKEHLANISYGYCMEIADVFRQYAERAKQEQQEVDLVTEYDEQFDSDPVYGKLANRNAGIAIARHFYELGLNARKEVDIVPLQEERMVCYINYCLRREDDECHCPTCGKYVTGLRLFPYYYDRKNNDVYFASVCPECGKIIISKE